MQILLLAITFTLSLLLYKLLSGYRASYPFIRTTRISRSDKGEEFLTTESEHGLVTIEKDAVIIEGREYSLVGRKGQQPEALLNLNAGKLISITIYHSNGDEKLFLIDPHHSLFFKSYHETASGSESHRHIFSF
jgi:hypothetical protein